MKAAEDKTFPGAVAASLTSPWGQAVSAGDPKNTYFGSYREVFARDLYEAWTAVFLAGDRRTATDMTRFLFERQQQPDGSMPRNSLPNGKLAPDSFNTQLDECAYPLIMALAVGLTDNAYYKAHIAPAANFVASHGPSFGPERWEEQSGFSPSTISAEIAGLIAAAIIADKNGDHDSARVWRATADEFQRNLKKWTLTTNGPLEHAPVLHPPLEERRPQRGGHLQRRQRRPGPRPALGHRRRLPRVRPPRACSSPTTPTSSPRCRWSTRRSSAPPPAATASCATTATATATARPTAIRGRRRNKGTGHPWPVLAGERGQYEVDRGAIGSAIARLDAMRNMSSGVGLIAEQAWDLPDLAASPFGTDPTIASIGFRNGKADGSASALTWSAGQFVRLTLDTAAGSILDRPELHGRPLHPPRPGPDRAVGHGAGRPHLVGNSVTVTGTTTPGNRVIVAATNIDTDFPTTLHTRRRSAADGSFSVADPAGRRDARCSTPSATSPSGATARVGAHGRRLRPAARHAVIFAADDPDNDDNGPGNYAYPTDAAVPPRRLRHRAVRRSTTPAPRSSSACARAT